MKYYEAYDLRYRQVHEKGLAWFGGEPTPIVGEMLAKFAIPPQSPMLEIGCGEGGDAAFLLERGCNLTATDVSAAAIDYCREKHPRWAEHFSVLDCLKDETDKRREGAETRYLFDTAYLAARAVREMKEMTKEALQSALRATPDVYVSELKCYPSSEHKAALLGRLSQLPPTAGVRLAPGFFSLRIVSSAQRFEAALDNAMEFRGKINEIEKEIRGK